MYIWIIDYIVGVFGGHRERYGW